MRCTYFGGWTPEVRLPSSVFCLLLSVAVRVNLTFSGRKVIMCKKFMCLYSIIFVLAAGGVAVADPFQQDPGPDGIVSVEA